MKRTLTSLAIIILIASAFWAFAAPPPYTRTHETDAEIRQLITDSAGSVTVQGSGDWMISTDGTNYYAKAGFTNLVISGRDFAVVLQAAHDQTPLDAVSFKIGPIGRTGGGVNPSGYNYYNFSNTVILTKACVMIGTGDPSTIFWAVSGLNKACLQFGTAGVQVGGIVDVRNIRFQAETEEVLGVGVHYMNVSEPNVKNCEFFGFGMAGIRLSGTTATTWAGSYDTWYVIGARTNACGILIDGASVDSEFIIDRCMFGMSGGEGIVVSNFFNNIQITGNRFRYDAGTVGSAIHIEQGIGFHIVNNFFPLWTVSRRPINFGARAASTNLNSIVALNHNSFGGSSNFTLLGANVIGVIVTNNIYDGIFRP